MWWPVHRIQSRLKHTRKGLRHFLTVVVGALQLWQLVPSTPPTHALLHAPCCMASIMLRDEAYQTAPAVAAQKLFKCPSCAGWPSRLMEQQVQVYNTNFSTSVCQGSVLTQPQALSLNVVCLAVLLLT